MTDFDAKFSEMQKYLPFLKNVIEKLRSSSDQGDDNPRMAQLKKMEVLHDLLKSNGKKLKMETLLKCEGLLLKLHSKMVRIPLLQNESDTSKPTYETSYINDNTTTTTMLNKDVPKNDNNNRKGSSDAIVDITGPESPPPQQMEEEPPLEIPTERRSSPTRDKSKHSSRHERHNKHHHNHQHYRQQSDQEMREYNDQINLNRMNDIGYEGTNDSSDSIFNRRSIGIERSSENTHHPDRYRNRDPRASAALSHDIYSPEQCWDEVENFTKASSSSATSIITKTMRALTTSPIDEDDTPAQKQSYHDTIFNFKKQQSKPNEMFVRLRNPDNPNSSRSPLLGGRSAPISIPAKVRTIPEVLKSPPLSASDISDLLNESDEKVSDSSIPSISEIGTRRPTRPLNATKTPDTEITDLDKVRKKFAIVTRSSPQLQCSSDVLKSPVPIERVALKYNPHPRTELSNVQLPMDPRLNPNRFGGHSNPPQDPRLRRAAETASSQTSLYQQAHASDSSSFIESDVGLGAKSQQPQRLAHIPSIVDGEVIQTRPPVPAAHPTAVMDPRKQLGNQSKLGMFSRRDQPTSSMHSSAYGVPQQESPNTTVCSPVNAEPQQELLTSSPTYTSNNERVSPITTSPKVKQRKSGYSSEENWDSDPETAVATKATTPKVTLKGPLHVVPQSQPHERRIGPNDVHLTPRDVHVGPHSIQVRLHCSQVVQREAQVRPHCPQVRPRGPQIGQHVPQVGPHGPQIGHHVPQIGQRGPQIGPHGSRVLPHRPQVGHLGPQVGQNDDLVELRGQQVVPHSPQVEPHGSHDEPQSFQVESIHTSDNERVSPITTSPKVQQRKSGYSSEENWDSDPETPVPTKAAAPKVTPNVAPQNRPHEVHAGPHNVHASPPNVHVAPHNVHASPENVHVGPHGNHDGLHGSKVGQRGAQAGPHGPQVGPQSPQVGPLGPKIVSHGPQIGPQGSQVGPHGSRALPNRPPVGQNSAIVGVRGPQVGPQGTRVGPHSFQGSQAGPHGAHVGSLGSQVGPHGPQVGLHFGQIGPHVPQVGPHGSQVGSYVSQISHPTLHPVSQPVPHPYGNPHVGHAEGGFRTASNSTMVHTAPYGRLNPAISVPPHILNHPHSTGGLLPNPNPNKFSALLNDKTERSKYFESKKQKQSEPRTYMEYKQAKARAAAEEAARKAAEEATKSAAEVGKDIGKVSEVDSSVLAKLSEHTPVTSTLDKLYRSTNFGSCEFPKAKTSFKIPKKAVEKGDNKIENEKKSLPEDEESDNLKREIIRKAGPIIETSVETTQPLTTGGKKKTEGKEQVPKKNKNENNENGIKKRYSKENVKKDSIVLNKKNIEKPIKKSLSKTQNINDTIATEDERQSTATEVEAQIPTKTRESEIVTKTQSISEDVLKAETKKTTEEAIAQKKAVEMSTLQESKDKLEAICDVTAETDTKIQDADIQNQDPVEQDNITPNSNVSKEVLTNESQPLAEIIKELESPPRPARILRRRNTMIVRGSVPEVDKEKIFPFKSLVYEDIQGAKEEERRKEIDAKRPRENKYLAEIFQKTDDNCKVSTQNIISGKRRTRPNVNFNEVQRSQEVFRVKRRSEPGKTNLTNDNKAATTPAVKNTTPPKGKKVKGKLKYGPQSGAESVDGDEKITVKSTKTERVSDADERNQLTTNAEEKSVKLERNSIPVESVDCLAKPSTSKIDGIMDEDAQKRHLLESFVQDILNPKKDKAKIFCLLSQILSEDNLKFVKDIVESTAAEKNATQNEETTAEVCDDEEESVAGSKDYMAKLHEENEAEKEDKHVDGSESIVGYVAPKKTVTKGKKKKNELDRLNEDIRTMFISKGVLTATGRRMCTLVAAVEQATTSKDSAQLNVSARTTPEVELKTKAKITSLTTHSLNDLPRLRKAKVVLEQINVKEIQKRVRMQRMAEEKKRQKLTDTGDEDSESEISAVVEKIGKTPPRKMPILKAHTPIKQSEVEDDDETTDESDGKPVVKKIKIDKKLTKKAARPGPKSKKLKSALTRSDDEESNASERVMEKTNKVIKKSTKPTFKNTNPEWNLQSKWAKWCMICDQKIVYATTHYIPTHGENFVSRPSPNILEELKAGKRSKPYFGVNQKKTMYWFYRCPFCQQHNRTTSSSWFDHFITHTGEYAFECSNCRRLSSKSNLLDNHIKTVCIGATIVRNPTISMTKLLHAHVCHLCNYTQLHRHNLDSHLIQQHGIAKAKVAKLGYTVDLFDTRDGNIVDPLRAAELEAKIINARFENLEVLDIGGENESVQKCAAEKEDQNKKQKITPQKLSKIKVKSIENIESDAAKDDESDASEESNDSNEGDARNDNDQMTDSNDSDDSDNMPIVKIVESHKKAIANKIAVNKMAVENALKSNVFVSTRETNESPTMNNLAQSLFTIDTDASNVGLKGAASTTTTVATASRSDVGGGGNVGISIAERLSQKFKNIQSAKFTATTTKAITNTTNSTITATATTTTIARSIMTIGTDFSQENNNQQETPLEPLLTSTVNTTEKEKINETTSADSKMCTINEKISTATDASITMLPEDDDENWEDIEIVESAPSTASSSSTSSKQSKGRNKNVLHKLNRLYATNTKLKKSLSITIGNRKKATTEERTKEMEAYRTTNNENNTSRFAEKVSVPIATAAASEELSKESELTVGAASVHDVTMPTINIDSNLGFRPLITNLADLLPDSPCNDPIELVPELTPIESLQDLCDVSSILNSDYISNDWQNNILPLNLNNDNISHVSMQEALDFVHEQQQQLEQCDENFNALDIGSAAANSVTAVTTTNSITNSVAPIVASIHRIQNIGYSKAGDDYTFKFYCLSENCTFLYSNEAIGLESHFSCEHAQCTWSGHCQSCKAQVEGNADVDAKLPLSAELKHLRTKHLNITAPVTSTNATTSGGPPKRIITIAGITTIPSATLTKTTPTVTSNLNAAIEELKQPSASNSPGPDDDRPRIKIRRLTGDCLSTTTPTPTITNTELSSKTMTAFDENAQLIEISNIETLSNTKMISTSFLDQTTPTTTEILEQPKANENRHFQNIGAQSPSNFSTVTHSPVPADAPPCQFQITNVVSLKENANKVDVTQSHIPASTQPSSFSLPQLPIISNVCSLNTRSISSHSNNSGAMWSQHIADERAELERSATESMEISRILAAAKRSTAARNSERSTALSESPEPQVVAETVPVAQATSGSYLITQTVSAQYEEGRLGFNISIANNPSARLSRSDSSSNASTSSAPTTATNATAVISTVPQFKCMAIGCKYQTRLPLAMGDHLLFHDQQNFGAQREYLRCCQCSFLAEDIDGFLHHTEQNHGMMMRTNSEAGVKNDGKNSNKNAFGRKGAGQSFTQETWEKALREIIAATGIPDSKLFRCTIEDCKTKLTESTYYSHVVYHLTTLGHININTHTYKCPHCKSTFNKPQKIKTHIKTHGVHKYFCYLCMETSFNIDQMIKHYDERHWRTKKLRSTPLPYKLTDKQNLYYVLFNSSLNQYEMQQFREKLIAEWQRKKSISRTHYKPSEIGLLPLTPIFGRDLNCAICAYKTKVRTNLMRHLQMHTDDNNDGTQHVSNVDPINPVPCLNSSEKHFDKMTNLASSSLVVGSTSSGGSGTSAAANGGTNNVTGSGSGGGGAGGAGGAGVSGVSKVPYDYVPDIKRYTCGVSNCQYLTISDDIFRSHLNALHSDIVQYNCPHCKEEICKRNLSIERILSHLRFHGPKLYQCEFCSYLHYMKNVVDRHTRQHDVHPPLVVKVIEYDRTKDNTANANLAPATQTNFKIDALKSKSKQKWSCNLCGHKTMTQQQMTTHATMQHACKHQYQCIHCTFTAPQLIHVMTHIDEKHVQKKRGARYIYEQQHVEEEIDNTSVVNTIDTRPLWFRDDPTRVRHIRGILMEDEEESERYRKCSDDYDEGTENGDSDENINLNHFGYLCYYCNLQFTNPNDLHERHWKRSNCNKFNEGKPFRYRICTQLKCPYCLAFGGNSFVLMEHMKIEHKTTKYLAVDANATAAGLTCGHCVFRAQTVAQLGQHNSQIRHKPLDFKVLTLEQLQQLKAQGTPLSYVQCLTCMELLTDQKAFESHTSLVHASNVNEIKSQKLENILIYACPKCQYASHHEMTVLRHMIDHFSGFKQCHFCRQPQTTFNGYMQHCYSDHREEIKKFCEIYTFTTISRFLEQMHLVFPNGLTIDMHNLRMSQCFKEYGSKHIKFLYEEIQKTSQQPPIPRLSLGRLVARKSIEAKLAETGVNSTATQDTRASASTAAAMQLAGNYAKPLVPALTAQKIMKRRSTVALGRGEPNLTYFATPSPSRDMMSVSLSNGKKRKIQQAFGLLPPISAKESETGTETEIDNDQFNFVSISDNEISEMESEIEELQPYSFYGKKPESMDLSKIFIKIAAGDTIETRVNISKFKLLYNITPRVVVTPTDMTKYHKVAVAANKRKIIKPCPLSHKIRYS